MLKWGKEIYAQKVYACTLEHTSMCLQKGLSFVGKKVYTYTPGVACRRSTCTYIMNTYVHIYIYVCVHITVCLNVNDRYINAHSQILKGGKKVYALCSMPEDCPGNSEGKVFVLSFRLCWYVLQSVARICSVLQCAAVCCSVLQCVAVCCSVLQCVVVCCSVLQCVLQCVVVCCSVLSCVVLCCSVLQGIAVCCRILQCVAACYCVLQCVAVCCSVSQCVAVVALCCSVLQCVALTSPATYGVATISRLLKVIGLFCKRAL